MSNTPKLADECKKLLDNKWCIMLFKNELGTYTAVACKPGQSVFDAMEVDSQITDDFEPSQALYRLTEKVYGRIVMTTIRGQLWKIVPHGDGFAVMQNLPGDATGLMLDESGKWSVVGRQFETEDEARKFGEGLSA
jgi:hypothetical protein